MIWSFDYKYLNSYHFRSVLIYVNNACYLYYIKKELKSTLKGIVVKDMVGNRAKIGQEALWRYRALKYGNYLFKHEYIFVFRKEVSL